jgi:hypothetical protein
MSVEFCVLHHVLQSAGVAQETKVALAADLLCFDVLQRQQQLGCSTLSLGVSKTAGAACVSNVLSLAYRSFCALSTPAHLHHQHCLQLLYINYSLLLLLLLLQAACPPWARQASWVAPPLPPA